MAAVTDTSEIQESKLSTGASQKEVVLAIVRVSSLEPYVASKAVRQLSSFSG